MGASDEAPDDDRLLAAYVAGDGHAFEQLFARHRRGLHTWLLLQCGDAARAEDHFQEVFLRVIRSAASYRAHGQFRAWLFTIAHNVLNDGRRRAALRSPENEMSDAATDPGAALAQQREVDPATRSHAHELAERLTRALQRLPEEQREVFLLRERGGLELAAIAQVTGANLATVKSRLRYALAALRRGLGEDLVPTTEARHE